MSFRSERLRLCLALVATTAAVGCSELDSSTSSADEASLTREGTTSQSDSGADAGTDGCVERQRAVVRELTATTLRPRHAYELVRAIAELDPETTPYCSADHGSPYTP